MATSFVPLIGPVPGGMELVVILLIAVLLFGANKIPKLARSTGQAMGEFQRGREEVEQELQEIKEGGSETDSEDTLGGSDATTADADVGTESETETSTESTTDDS